MKSIAQGTLTQQENNELNDLYQHWLWYTKGGREGVIKSFDDLVADPKSIWGKSADEVEKMLGEGWEKQPLNSGEGWKFIQKDGDGFVSFTSGNSHHPNSTYYKINSGTAGKNKVVGKGYIPSKDDKSKIFYVE